MNAVANYPMTATDSQLPHDTCAAKTRAGTPCQLPAGWGTDHAGSGRCKLHGGKSPGRPVKHGLYAVKHHQTLTDKIEQFRDAPVDNLADELALMRALLQDVLGKLTASPDAETREAITTLVGEIRQLVSTIVKVRNSTALTGQEIQLFMLCMSGILQKYVPAERLPDAVNELRTAFQPR